MSFEPDNDFEVPDDMQDPEPPKEPSAGPTHPDLPEDGIYHFGPITVEVREKGHEVRMANNVAQRHSCTFWKCSGANCEAWVEESEAVWATKSGKLDTDKGDPYCDSCVPQEEEDPGEDPGDTNDIWNEDEDDEPEAAHPNNCLKGFKCPNCGADFEFVIEAKASFTVRDDGTDYDYSDVEWDDDSFCRCGSCGKQGKVKDFTEKKPKYKVIVWLRADVLPEHESIFDSRVEAEAYRDHWRLLHPENHYEIEELKEES